MSYRVRFHSSAARDLASPKIPRAVADSVLMFAQTALAEEPARVGKPLHEPYLGLWSARRGDFRIIYEIDFGAETVLVRAVNHRADAYRPRS
ncbi:type II toxin-antitoxin system RelE/ParE family toxin [Micromonospora tulbaghiae]|uniref:type II toxin-antitoxin system RelE family toxin n=1 Tax=Micromonospora tulbaghiae TaxID=479978 RepID=UPI003416F67D